MPRCLALAEDDPTFVDLLRLEQSLPGISEEASRLRSALSLLAPSDLTYPAQIAFCIDALASGQVPRNYAVLGQFDLSGSAWFARRRFVARVVAGLRHWVATGQGEFIAELRERSKPKCELCTLVIERLETGCVDAEALSRMATQGKLGSFAQRVEALDARHWSFEHDAHLLLESIGAMQVRGEWHRAGGPLGHEDADPTYKPAVEATLSRLEWWLYGGQDDELGRRNAYAEKLWLARCFATYLQYHLRACYGWTEQSEQVETG
jgi:hypothetical protein